MRLLGWAFVLAACSLTQSCSREPTAVVELEVSSQDPLLIQQTDELLLSRFRMLDSTLTSSVESEIRGTRLTYTFYNGGPSRDRIKYLYSNPGIVKMYLAEDDTATPIITRNDIERMELQRTDSGDFFDFQLTPEAGDLMLTVTSNNLNKVMILEVDDVTLMKASIRGVFARYFRASAPDVPDIGALYATMYFGPLPTKVASVSSQDGA